MNQPLKKSSPRGSKVGPRLVMGLAVAGVAVLALVSYQTYGGPAATVYSTHKVGERSLYVTVKKDGELQAVNNIEIICEVEGSTAIQSIVREGSSVKKGDILVQLDSATIRQRIEDTTLELRKAEADLTTSREMMEIQKSQNAANYEAAQATLDAAEIDLRKFVEGDYPQKLKDAETAVKMAEIDLKNKEADFAQVQDLAAKQFLTPTEVELRRVDLLRTRNALEAARTALRNLTIFEKQKNQATFETALSQSRQRLVRTERENRANLAQREADLGSKEQSVDLIRRKLSRFKEQYEACTIRAPEDGLVVYATSGDRNAQQQIQEGATVRERQMILRLPDTSRMKAVVRIQESQVTRLREGQRAVMTVTGINKPLTGTVTKISVLADSGQRWWNPDVKEYPVDVELDETPVGLKPGVGVSPVEIMIARLESAVTVPVSTIYSAGARAYVFAKPLGDEDPKPIEVKLGLANETDVEVKEGLAVGQEIVVLQAGQGRELLQRAGIPDEPATRPSFRGGGGPGRGEGGGGRRNREGGAPGGPGGTPGGGNGAPAAVAPATPAGPAAVAPAAPAPESPTTRKAVTSVETR